MDYRAWNDAIASHFFRPEMSGRRVHLYVTRELIEEIGAENGASLPDFVETTRAGCGFARTGYGSFEGANQWSRRWRTLRDHMGLVYPPYISHLALAVLAAGFGDENEFSTSAYYPRLRTLLGEGSSKGNYPGFEMLSAVWEDLERWSSDEKRGEWGVFEVRRAGSRVHVDIPIAQTLLAETEREALHRVFALVGFHPALPPSERELAATVLAKAKGDLRPWTARLLSGKVNEPGFREALLSAMAEELMEWDGTVPPPKEAAGPGGAKEKWRRGGMAICLNVRPLGPVEFRLRCNVGGDAPPEGWELVLPDGCIALCEEDLGGWSTTLRGPGGVGVDAASFDWAASLELRDEGRGIVYKMAGAPLRVFVSGAPLMLSGFVETRQLPLGVPFFAAVRWENAGPLEAWGEASCDGFVEVRSDTLPASWRLFRANAARDVAGVEGAFPQLALPSSTQLSLAGGVVMDPPFEYFDFAPPSVRVRSSLPVDLVCNGRTIAEAVQDVTVEVPQDLMAGQGAVRIEATRDGQAVRSLRFFVRSQFDAAGVRAERWFGEFGEGVEVGADSFSFAGASVRTDVVGESTFNTLLELPAYGKRRVFLIGKEAGQIACWPHDPLPSDWQALWAIPFDRKGRVEYCGPGLPVPPPVLTSRLTKKQRREWREKVYGWRKLVERPNSSVLGRAWKGYVDAAASID